jgi:hypothetical protein
MTSIARQWSCKHASLKKEGDFRGVRAEEFWRQSALQVQLSVGDSHGKFVVEEQLEVSEWRLNVWTEDLVRYNYSNVERVIIICSYN